MKDVWEKLLTKLNNLAVYTEVVTSDKHPFTASEIDLISRKKVLAAVEEAANEYCNAYEKGFEDGAESVRTLAPYQSTGWIPADGDNLPKDHEDVRVTLWSGHERLGYRKDEKWYVYGGCGIAEASVIAWQPTQPYQPFKEIIDKLDDKIEVTWAHDYTGGRKDAFKEAIEVVRQTADKYGVGRETEAFQKILETLIEKSIKWYKICGTGRINGNPDEYASGMKDAFDESIRVVEDAVSKYIEKERVKEAETSYGVTRSI